MRRNVLAVLVVLWGAALIYQFRPAFLWHSILSVFLVCLFDTVFAWVRARRWALSPSSLISGLLIGMLLDPNSGFVTTAAACLFASGSKHFIGTGAHRHIFNPAAFGVVASSWLFHRPVAWWASSWGVLPVVIVSVGMLPILWRMHRHIMPFSFLTVFFLTHLFYGSIESALRLTLDGTVFLFALVMLPEPRTAPIAGAWWWGWGALVGLLVVAQSLFRIQDLDPLLVALLVANLYSAFYKGVRI